MRSHFYLTLVFFITSLTSFSTAADGDLSLEITVTELRSDRGVILLAMFTNEKGFPGEEKGIYKKAEASISNKKAFFRLKDLPAGKYALSLIHDENANYKLDTAIFGIPKEGVGSSNNPKPKFGPPKWEQAVFELAEKVKKLTIEIAYIFD